MLLRVAETTIVAVVESLAMVTIVSELFGKVIVLGLAEILTVLGAIFAAIATIMAFFAAARGFLTAVSGMLLARCTMVSLRTIRTALPVIVSCAFPISCGGGILALRNLPGLIETMLRICRWIG